MNNKLLKNLTTYLFLTIMLQIIFEGLVNPNNVFLYTVGTTTIYLLIISAIYYLNKNEINEMFFSYKKNWKKNLKKNIITWIIGFIVMMLVNYLITFIVTSLPTNEKVVRELYTKYLLASIISNIFLAPILEEFVFRLSFNQINNKYFYLLLSSFIFGLFHTLGSLDKLINIIYILPYFTLGMAFGIIYYRSENIFDSILIHAIHNALVLGLYFIV